MFSRGDVISYLQMCDEEGVSLQKGMNFRLKGKTSIILMSLRPGAPYPDRVEDEGAVLIYEGHDIPRRAGSLEPKAVDQPTHGRSGRLTQNGLFLRAVAEYKNGRREAEIVKVYEKVRSGIWVYDGLFKLVSVAPL